MRPGVSLLVAAFLGARCAAGSDPVAVLGERWRWRVFDRAEGLSSNAAMVLYQDSQRRLHVATDRGLCRYDLHHWQVIPHPAADTNESDFDPRRIFESLGVTYCVTSRALWAVRGGTRLERRYPPPGASLSPARLFAASDTEGAVHYLIDPERRPRERLLRVRGGRLDVVSATLPPGRIQDYAVDSRRVHWLATDSGLYYRDLRRGRWVEARPDRDLDPDLRGLECVRFLPVAPPPSAGDHAGALWGLFVTPGGGGAWKLGGVAGDGFWRGIPSTIDGPPVERVLAVSGGHHLATCEDGRLFVRRAGSTEWVRASSGLGEVKLFGGLVDVAGDLWFRLGAGGVALVNMRSRRWERLRPPVGRSYARVLSLLETSGGEIWVGTEHGVVRYRDGGEGAAPELHESILGTPLERITALAEDSQGRVWIGSGAIPGAVFTSSPEGTWTRAPLAGAPVRRIVTDPRGELWFLLARGPAGGARIYRRSAYTKFELQPVTVESEDEPPAVNDLLRTQRDDFWLATENGLWACRLGGGGFQVERRYGVADGLASPRVWAVAEGPGGAIWVSYPNTGHGATRILDGEVSSYDVEDGIASSAVWSVASGPRDLWLGTERGLSRFDGECWYAYRVASADSLSSWVVSLLVSAREGGTALLVGTAVHGVWWFRMDDQRLPRFASLELPERTDPAGSVEFSWRARDYKNETPPGELLYRYRLDGGPWSSFQHAERVRLEALAPGPHTFELEVRDLDGNRNPREVLHTFQGPAAGGAWLLETVLAGAALLAGAFAAAEVARRVRRLTLAHGRYRNLFLHCPAAVLVLDRDGRLRDTNPAARRLLGLGGLDARELSGKSWRLIPALAAPEVSAALESLVAGEIPAVFLEHCAPLRHEERVLAVVGFPLAAARGGGRPSGVVLVLVDRTDQVEAGRLEERERRLAGLRELAARIGERLEAIAARLRAGLKESGAAREGIAGLEDLTSLLGRLSFCPADRDAAGTLELGALLGPLLGREGPGPLAAAPGVKVELRLAAGLWSIRGCERRLAEALSEVFRNAVEAMPGGGVLAVHAVNVRIERDAGPLAPGRYVEVTVADSGPGLDAIQLETIFDPFYSTKPREGARGVGLSLAYAILRGEGGDIRVRSRPRKGTTVTLWLPAAPPGAGSGREAE